MPDQSIVLRPPGRIAPSSREVLKTTTSRCPVCHIDCPGTVWKSDETPPRVYLDRVCPSHGTHSACIASDARFYWLSRGDAANGGCGCGPGSCRSADGSQAGTLGRNAGGRGTGVFESLSTCVALIEIVETCNLACPTCYADSGPGAGARVKAPSLEQLQERIQGVVDRKGGIEILQLSGGEPTLHPRFFELLEWAQGHSRIDYILINTNGVRVARDAEFRAGLAAAALRRKLQLYLQFDGVQTEGQVALRGTDLRAIRHEVLEHTSAMGLPVTLAMTVTADNLPHLWTAIASGLEHPHVQGVTFQPFFQSGRGPATPSTTGTCHRPLTTADIVTAAVGQSAGRLRFSDFTPLPCGDPNCATIGYLLRTPSGVRSVSDFIDFTHIQGFLHDRLQYRLEDLARCGCDSEPLGRLIKDLELSPGVPFRMLVKPFMDDWTWDQDRIDRCCTHVIREDGRLDSFCRHYATKPAVVGG